MVCDRRRSGVLDAGGVCSIFLTTTIAPAVATCTTLIYTWVKNGKPDFGDGKIFVYGVENVIKVRTGEEGYDALRNVE